MSWNNRKETRIFEAQQKKLQQYYIDNGMTQEQINAMLAYDKRQWLNLRNQKEHDFEIIPFPEIESINPTGSDSAKLMYKIDSDLDPFVFGFDDPRLNAIWKESDEINKQIMRFLAEGKTQDEISKIVGISQKGVSKRIQKMRKLNIF